MAKKVRVAIVGLGFGAEFIPIYQAHPDAEMYAICRRNKAELDKLRRSVRHRQALHELRGSAQRSERRRGPHQLARFPITRRRVIAALKAGKHVACTVPMATSVEDASRSSRLQQKAGKIYMMMETVVYSREYLFAKELYDRGVLGRIQFLRGSHQQDMDGWPDYWPGLPPMWYATHCVSPCLAILSTPGQAGVARASSATARAGSARS